MPGQVVMLNGERWIEQDCEDGDCCDDCGHDVKVGWENMNSHDLVCPPCFNKKNQAVASGVEAS